MSKGDESQAKTPGFSEDPLDPWMKVPRPAAAESASLATMPPPAPYGHGPVPAALYGPAPLPAAPPSGKKNWMGITSLVLGVVGGGVIGIIFGVLGLNAVKAGEANNRGIALAGVIVNSVLIGLSIVILAVVTIPGATVGTERKPTLEYGDCFDLPEGNTADSTELDGLFTVKNCNQLHFGEVYHVGTITSSTYPELDDLYLLDNECWDNLEGNFDLDAIQGEYYSFIYPLEADFNRGERNFVCFLYDDQDMVGSVLLR